MTVIGGGRRGQGEADEEAEDEMRGGREASSGGSPDGRIGSRSNYAQPA